MKDSNFVVFAALVAKGYLDEARTVLTKCGTDTRDIDDEVREIQASLDLEHHSLQEPFFNRKYLKPILLAVAIAMFNQLSGINALMYYAPHIFKMAGAAAESALLQTVAVGSTNLILTMAALLVIDHFGRKKLMLVGLIGYILSLGTTAWAFYTLCMVGQLLWVLWVMPETKGISLEQIQKKLGIE